MQGARVWVPDPTTVWTGAEVKKFENKELHVVLEDGRVSNFLKFPFYEV